MAGWGSPVIMNTFSQKPGRLHIRLAQYFESPPSLHCDGTPTTQISPHPLRRGVMIV